MVTAKLTSIALGAILLLGGLCGVSAALAMFTLDPRNQNAGLL